MRKLVVKGDRRQYEHNGNPGLVWVCDVLHLPETIEKHRYVLVMVERLCGYIKAVPLKAINNNQLCQAFRQIMCCIPQMRTVISDQGTSDFGSGFMKLLAELGIRHKGNLHQHSQIASSAEIANRILTSQLTPICSSHQGKKYWHLSLCKCILSINAYTSYRTNFSRSQLFFSPFYFTSKTGPMSCANPVSAIKNTYNDKRISNLTRARGTVERFPWF